jgi:hypothetical protein
VQKKIPAWQHQEQMRYAVRSSGPLVIHLASRQCYCEQR